MAHHPSCLTESCFLALWLEEKDLLVPSQLVWPSSAFLSYLRLSIYMSVVSIAIVISFHLKNQPTPLELHMAIPLGIVFWCLGVACLIVGFGNYVKTVKKYSMRMALVQTGWKTQAVSSSYPESVCSGEAFTSPSRMLTTVELGFHSYCSFDSWRLRAILIHKVPEVVRFGLHSSGVL